ncbi:MAG: hypothetical protein WD077_08190 [Bacteroidia bacterium]
MGHIEALSEIQKKIEQLGMENRRLMEKLEKISAEKNELEEQLRVLEGQENQLEKKNLNLQIAQTLKEGAGLHEDSQKTEQLKNHIDKLMKEIDRCIHLLKYDNEL